MLPRFQHCISPKPVTACVSVLFCFVEFACNANAQTVSNLHAAADKTAAREHNHPSASIEEELLRTMREGDIPGLSITRIEQGNIGWTGVFGRRRAMDLSIDSVKVDKDTVFEAASLGKTIVAIAALKLIEQGKLGLDSLAESIVSYPELTDARSAAITVRMLLSHTSGLAFAQASLDADPGARFSYSTVGYRYLQKIVEEKTNLSLEDWAAENLFGPLNMERSSFNYSDRFTDNRAIGRNWLMVGQEYMANAAGTGAFDLITTSQDYAKLWVGILEGKVISRETLELMFTPQKPITGEFYDGTITKKSKTELACGLGILLQKQDGKWIGFQWGDNGGSTGCSIVNLQHSDVVVFLTNAQDGLHACEKIAEIAGMSDDAMTWVGYEQFNTKSRLAWKEITAAMERSDQEGFTKYAEFLEADVNLALRISRNLGYYNRFKGRVTQSESYFRNASTVERQDAQLLCDWSEALVLAGKVEEAATIQQRAIEVEPTLAKDLNLSKWVIAAKFDLASPARVVLDHVKSIAGQYDGYSFELDPNASLVMIGQHGRKILVPTKSGDFLSQDMVVRAQFDKDSLLLTIAGKPAIEIKKSRADGSRK